ncbi:MAG: tripartite tricarboxylate transporter substrate binding protein BugD [Alphaproteobacteria bacterium]|nr:tripartite tricarboxylate transporter substrate binding protein BugD [Alphaproteobacteria bacterium]
MRRLLAALGAVVVSLLSSPIAFSQTFPTKPVTMVVPFAAGGPTDALARIIAESMSRHLGQTVVIDNTTGAAGTIAVGKVVRAPNDGYTVSIGHVGTHVVNGAIYPKLGFDLLSDLEPVILLPSNPQLILSKNDVPAKTLAEFVAYVKANQAKLSAGNAGLGSGSHIGGMAFEKAAGVKLQYVPYRGTGPAMQDLISGQIDLMIDQTSNALPQVRAGKVRAYAITAPARSAAAPDIPTVDEAGLPGMYVTIWHGLWVPKGTPAAVIARLNAAANAALDDPAVRKRLADLGQDIPPADQRSPAALRAFHKAEADKWWPLIKAAGVKIE